MNLQRINQISGVLRSLLGFVVPVLVGWSLIDQATIDQLTPQTEHLVELVLGSGGVVVTLMAIWSVWSNEPKAVVKQTGGVKGVIVTVFPGASKEIKDLAADPKVPGVASPILPVGPPTSGGSASRNYSGITIPYQLPNWKLNMAFGYIRPYWDDIPTIVANKIAQAYNGRTDLIFDRKDLDALPEKLWVQIKPYL